jgi:anti-anti-sigma factor
MVGVMELRAERIDSAVILHLDGRMSVDADTDWMRDVMNASTDYGVRHALLDLGKVSALDCSGIGQLLRLREQVHGARRTFGLVDVDRRQKRLLELSGLVHVFRVFADCESAVSALGLGPPRHPSRPPEAVAPLGAAVGGRMAACWGIGTVWMKTECAS